MPVLLEIFGACVFGGLLMLGVYKAVEWYQRRNQEVPTNGANE